MGDFLEFSNVVQEVRGAMHPGRLKLQSHDVIFKNMKTGKVDHFNADDIETTQWLMRAKGHCLKIKLNNNTIHRYDGFKEGEFDKLSSFVKNFYKTDLEKQDLSLRGWNWGKSKFDAGSLEFEIGGKTGFEIPLSNVSHTTANKNEVTLEFHQNDDAAVSLMELRFHVPGEKGDDNEIPAVEEFHSNILAKADIIQAIGESIATFAEVQCLTPRGRYDIKIYPTFLQLHGKTFDYKIPYTTVLRLFLLPHKDNRQMFFVVSLDPPIKQGQTRYPFLILLFSKEDECTLELTLSEEELNEKYEGKLQKEMTGPEYEIVSRVMKALVNRKITVPGSFSSHHGASCVGCSYKASLGILFPLERGFIFVHKPPIHIRFDEITNVNFARSTGSTRSFDFEVNTKAGTAYTFVGVEKDEYGKLYDFVTAKKLRVKNIDKQSQQSGTYDDILGSDSDNEGNHDAYMERMKAEAKERDQDDDDDESSEDSDYNPDIDQCSDVELEYDTDATSSATPSEDEGGNAASSSSDKDMTEEERKKRREEKELKRKKKHKAKKAKKAKTIKEPGTRKPRKKGKAKKDPNAPKRPQSGYFLWLNENRSRIKEENPDAGVADVAKIGGAEWGKITDKSEWDEKAKQAKEVYKQQMEEYLANKPDSDSDDNTENTPKKKKKTKTKSPKKNEESKGGSGANYKSKEFLDDDSSSSSTDSDDKPLKPKKTRSKHKEDGSGDDSPAGELPSEEEILSSPAHSEKDAKESESEAGSDSDSE
ncbi:unnamed protein product [Owenia fusiformis]|uniref:FACT complex subunit SSRP1 n=1 Tax=Owenia fusiformis TaxID=6347 RepID=A0A8J1TLR8_OWEFU|nr:unnamed protein product [Owenia fusiformis]